MPPLDAREVKRHIDLIEDMRNEAAGAGPRCADCREEVTAFTAGTKLEREQALTAALAAMRAVAGVAS